MMNDNESIYLELTINIVAILRQLSELRAQHCQLSRLLTPSERSGLGIDKLLQIFNDTKGVILL